MQRTVIRSESAVRYALLICVFSAAAFAQQPSRTLVLNGNTNWTPHPGADAALVVQPLAAGFTPTQLAQSILSGNGIVVSNVVYHGNQDSAGTFTSTNATILGFSNGIVLSSGNVMSVPGPNMQDATSTNNGLPGDASLQALVPNHVVHDACTLEFDFTAPTLPAGQTGAVNFNFVFSSEEYNEWVNTSYNDVFGFFLNGQNIAKLQNLTTPVQINTVNGGNPYGPPPSGTNWNQYRNNDLSDGGGQIDCEMDGLTITLTAHGNITGPGPHHIKLGIADAGDFIYDSNVFIQGASLVASQGPSFIAPTPTSAVNVTAQLPVSREVRGVANNGAAAANVTLSLTSVTFDAAFAGTPVPVTSPVTGVPALPQSGQPAFSHFTWTPPGTAVGVWAFTYHLLDNNGLTADHTVTVNVIPPAIAGPICVAPTPPTNVVTFIGNPTTWTMAAITNNGLPGAWVRIDSVSVEFDANFLGNAVPVFNPAMHAPGFPVIGQPALTVVNWTPPVDAVGEWTFDYHLIDNVGGLFDCSITVDVRDAALIIGFSPMLAEFTAGSGDFLRVVPFWYYGIVDFDQPDLIVPNSPLLIGFDVYAQVVMLNPGLYPTDPIKTSPSIRFTIGVANQVFGPGSGLDLIATGIAQPGDSLPYFFSVL